VASSHHDYAERVVQRLQAAGVRVDLVDAADQLGKRIRAAKLEKVPYVLVVGDDDVAGGTLGVNPRGGDVERGVGLEAFVDRITAEVADQLAATR
jgi:threonyl-tRNA synthetase